MEAIAVFHHHIYEYRKGLRNLVLFTCRKDLQDQVVGKLTKYDIPHVIYRVGEHGMNVFFGDRICIDVVTQIGKPDLTAYSDEEDFILGIMLGYARREQCMRYMKRKHNRCSRAVHPAGVD